MTRKFRTREVPMAMAAVTGGRRTLLGRCAPVVLAAATAALISHRALAQAAPQDSAEQSSTQADSQGQLQEFVVTARYRAENLQSTPLSITAITAEDLNQQALVNVNDIGNTIPKA